MRRSTTLHTQPAWFSVDSAVWCNIQRRDITLGVTYVRHLRGADPQRADLVKVSHSIKQNDATVNKL